MDSICYRVICSFSVSIVIRKVTATYCFCLFVSLHLKKKNSSTKMPPLAASPFSPPQIKSTPTGFSTLEISAFSLLLFFFLFMFICGCIISDSASYIPVIYCYASVIGFLSNDSFNTITWAQYRDGLFQVSCRQGTVLGFVVSCAAYFLVFWNILK